MKKITQNLRWLVTLLTMIVSVGVWAQAWVETDPSELVTGDIVVIADKTSSTAMSNDKSTSSAPLATAVTIEDEEITSVVTKNLQWEVTVTDDGEFMFGVGENYLYCNNTNNGVRVGKNTNNLFTIYDNAGTNFLLNSATSRYVGVYKDNNGEPQDWRCYTSINANIRDCVTAFYKRVGSNTPSITVDPTTVNATAEETEGTLAISYENLNISSTADFGIQYYDANNEEIDEPDWIGVEVESEEAGVSYMISYVVDANQGEARTAYCKVYAMDDETNLVYSNLITINQDAYVAPVSDFATLPFAFDDGKNAIESTDGLTQEGLDSDYGSSPKLKFNGTGDWVLLQFDEVPGNLSFDIKGNTFSGGTFTVQTSEDGETYTDLATYTELGDTQTETFDNLSSDVRYIKWIYTEKVSGNVALGNIKLEKPSTAPSITVNPATVDATAEETEGTLAISYNNLSISDMTDFGIQYYDANNEETTEPDWVEVLVAEAEGGENYLVSYYMINNEGDARTAYCKVFATGNDEFVYSNLITINQAAYVAPSDVVYKKVTSTADITDGQYLIVYEEGSVAFNGGLATLDAAGNTIGVVLNNGTIEGSEETEAAEFTINVTEGSLKSASGKYIGVTSNSNGLKQSEASDYTNSFAIEGGNAIISAVFDNSSMTLKYNKASDQNRFRYFKTGQQPIQLYKKVEKVVEEENITIGSVGYATYVTKKAISINENINAYAVLAINEKSVALGKLTEVPAKTPIIVEGTAGEYPCTVIEEAEDPAINLLQVSDGTVTGDGAIYALANKEQGVGFYPVGNGIEVPEGKAYLDTSSAKNQVKGFLALGGLADAINNIAVETANGTIFNIAGQKVQNITKGGLYIVNGKKVIVK